jgi:predicted RNA-binding protein with PUA-like domain
MAFWLLKSDPDEYGYDQLEADGSTAWDGVANAVALRHLRAMAPGDLAVVYATGDERRAVGVARVLGAGDPPTIAAHRRLGRPVTLSEIKAEPAFSGSPLVKMGRLSVVPLTEAQWRALLALSRTPM